MSTVLVTTPPGQLVRLELHLDEADWSGKYNQVQIFRSTTGEDGIYGEVTSNSWASAQIPESGGALPATPVSGPSANLVGKTLVLQAGSVVVTVVFAGTDPISYADAATQIAAALSPYGTAWVDSLGTLVVSTREIGSGARLEIVGGDGAGLLGLSEGTVSNGKEARLWLLPGVASYTFQDLSGSSDCFYKTRYFNSVNNTVGEFSSAFSAVPVVIAEPTSLIRGYLDLIDVFGKPAVGLEVTISGTALTTLADGKMGLGRTEVFRTDEKGHLEVYLMRGAVISLGVEGTYLARDINVPTDASLESFNLFDGTFSVGDAFAVQVPAVPYATRRSV